MGYLGLSQAILGYIRLSLVSGYIKLSQATMGYLILSRALSGYTEQSWLGYIWKYWLYMAISGYLYQESSIRVQAEAGKSNLLLFQYFIPFFSHVQVLEKLALLKSIS